MNEELQRQVVAILKALREESPQVFNRIIQDRLDYCWVHAGSQILITTIMIAIGLYIFTRFKGQVPFTDDGPTERGLCAVIGIIVITFSFVIGMINITDYVSQAIAPLGTVIGALPRG